MFQTTNQIAILHLLDVLEQNPQRSIVGLKKPMKTINLPQMLHVWKIYHDIPTFTP